MKSLFRMHLGWWIYPYYFSRTLSLSLCLFFSLCVSFSLAWRNRKLFPLSSTARHSICMRARIYYARIAFFDLDGKCVNCGSLNWISPSLARFNILSVSIELSQPPNHTHTHKTKPNESTTSLLIPLTQSTNNSIRIVCLPSMKVSSILDHLRRPHIS